MKTRIRGVLAAVICLVSLLPLSAQGLRLEVVNPTALAQADLPVSFGVPAPAEWNIYSVDFYSFGVADDAGTPVPAQFKVLSRWGGDRNDGTKAIKWVLVTFPASVAANSTRNYWMRSMQRPGGTLTINATSSDFVVSPRPGTSFTIDRLNFRLFRQAMVDGAVVVAAPGGGIELTSSNGALVNATVTETVLEDSGSVRAVLRQRGTLGSLRFTCRWTFHSGRSDVGVDFALENPQAYGHFFGVAPGTVYFDSLYLRLPVSSAAQLTTPEAGLALGNQTWRLDQDFQMVNSTNQAANFSFTTQHGTTALASGNRFAGSFDLSGISGGVNVAVDRFWQNFPKTVKASTGEMKIGLWPEWGNGPEYKGIYATPTSSDPIDPMAIDNYRFEGGRWKSHRMVFDFHSGDRSGTAVASLATRVASPLMGRPDPVWTKRSMAVGLPFADFRTWTGNQGMQRIQRTNELAISDSAADPIATYGPMGLPGFRQNGGTWGDRQFYGWDTYGDIPWTDGQSSLHYDWPLSVLLNWYRGGAYGFFDTGRDMAWIRRDYKQNHSTNTQEFWRGAQSYEKGWWAGNYRWGEQSHTWIHGVLLHYVMTGEEASREAAIECAEYQVRNSPRYWNGQWGARIPGWAIECLVDAWNYLGNPVYRTEAQAGVNQFQTIEMQQGSHGYTIDPQTAYSSGGLTIPANCAPWMHNIFYNAAARYTACTGDFQFMPFLARMQAWFQNSVVINEYTTATGGLRLPGVHSAWAPGWSGGESLHLLWPMLESYTWTFILTNNTTVYFRAASMFEALVRFHQAPVASVVNYADSSSWSPITFHMNQYPGTESKILGNILRWSISLPGAMTWMTGTW